ncbi:uncharacterized protein LOC112505531 [Cynara cardunculus var. scolymus]|uniref:uncharacterized protein LOC112505530 n=1 Tax=Cynara cardunculus var. scolymus TaxID=59895 RepID=UPI000D627E84|nr:uncharacterized protein LOC112505530 [Cynara cardunculus var. scolymus]XP_024965196.1 uncharacterized protein LOC112505531 [Cynara cardunculus var. scolymus]
MILFLLAAGPSNSIRLFGTTLSYCERHEATEATLNLNKQKRDSTELGLPPTFVALPTLPVEVPQTVSQLRSPLGFSATPVSSSEKGKQIVGNQTSQLSRFSQDEPSTIVTTSRYPLAPTPAVAPAPAPAPVSLDRGKQPIQASGSSSVRARPEPNPRFNRINRNNTRR